MSTPERLIRPAPSPQDARRRFAARSETDDRGGETAVIEPTSFYADWVRERADTYEILAEQHLPRSQIEIMNLVMAEGRNAPAVDATVLHFFRKGSARTTDANFGFGKFRGGVQGQFVVSPANALLEVSGKSDPFEVITVAVPTAKLEAAAHAAQLAVPRLDPLYAGPRADPQIERLVATALAASNEAGPAGTLDELYTDTLVSAMLTRLMLLSDRKPPTMPRHARLLPAAVRKVEDYLRAHLVRGPALQELALLVGYSPFHFSRLYKSATGVAPHERLTQLRLDCAKDRLKNQLHLTIAAIAQACGFSDHAHLTRLFKKHLGLTPSGFRREVLA